MKLIWEHHKTKGWKTEEVDMCTYLPSFTSAFSVNNTFCPLISLWITWWAWRCANPCIKEKRERRTCSEWGSWHSTRLPIPSSPKGHSTAPQPVAAGAMGPTAHHPDSFWWWRHRPQIMHTQYLNTAQHLHCANTSQLSCEESSAPIKSLCNYILNDISVSVRHWPLMCTGSHRI